MIGAANPFAGPDPSRLDALVEEIGQAFQAGYAPLAMRHIFDATLHPAVLSAAVAKAHAAGLVAIIATAAGGNRSQLITDLTDWIRSEVEQAARR